MRPARHSNFIVFSGRLSFLLVPSAVMVFASLGRRTVTSFVIPQFRSHQSVAVSARTFLLPNSAIINTRQYASSTAVQQKQQQQQTDQPQEYGVNMDQDALMESDMLVAVDENDMLIPTSTEHLSKRGGHTFNNLTPRATLHRAFSFFLFNEDNKLLLTQRAASKITFPNVWTNTVCSHPLYGMKPNEVDIVPDAYPEFPGIKHAAIRKCKHELGIESEFLPHEDIQFITRYHYWAADTITYGKETPWGEHEVDYILFLRTNKNIPIHPADDEVSDYKFVSMDELKEMLKRPDLLWSPWFLGIMERGGWDFWADLDSSLAGKHTNDKVTFFDPPVEHVANYNLPSHNRQTGVLQPN